MPKYLVLTFLLLGVLVNLDAQAIWVVNTTDDSVDGVCNAAHCSLGDAIEAANGNAGPDSIVFNIPGTGPHIIQQSAGPLPEITDPELVINGTSQAGNFPMDGQIVIDGASLAGINDNGLRVQVGDVRIYGLQIQNFPASGIYVEGGVMGSPAYLSRITIGAPDRGNVLIGNRFHGIEGDFAGDISIQSNFVGTDLAFSPGLGNGSDGVQMRMSTGANSIVGGDAAQRNYFCSNEFSGINIDVGRVPGVWTGELRVIGNHIGTDITGTVDLGNGNSVPSAGVFLSGEGALTIGGPGTQRNIIAFNSLGVFFDLYNLKTFNQNRWYCNIAGGVELANGANDNIQTPNSICVTDGEVNGVADPNVTIEIFEVDTSNCTGPVECQGTNLIGTTTSDASGFWVWNGTISAGTLISAVAIDALGNTSEFSRCTDYVSAMAVNDGPACLGDSVFIDVIPSGNSANATYFWVGPGGFAQAGKRHYAPIEGVYKCVVSFGDCTLDTVFTDVVYNPQTSEVIIDFCLGDSWEVNGNVYDENNTTGVEVIVGGNQYGCDSTIFFDLELNPSIQGRITTDISAACAGDSVEITFNINPGTFGPYEVIYTDGTGQIYTVQDIFNGSTLKQEVTEELIFDVIDINTPLTICDPIIGKPDTVLYSELALDPQITDYDGFGVSCKGAEDGAIILNPINGVGTLTYEWLPRTLEGDVVTSLEGGNYSVTVTDETGCAVVFDTILSEPPGADPLIEIIEPSCVGATDGVIIIDTVFDTEGNVSFSLDSINFIPISSYPIIIDTLDAGVKSIFFADESDCVVRSRLIMPEGNPSSVDVGGGKSIIVGDSVQLSFTTDIDDPDIFWEPPEIFDCPNCPEPFASPRETQYASVTLINAQGCTATDSLLIQVFIPKRAYIPNVFTPNGDGLNDFFRITGNEFAVGIESIIVVERGGVTVFSGQNLPIGTDDLSWDGNFKGQPVNPGVYTYLVEIRFNDNSVVPFSGTVTVIR